MHSRPSWIWRPSWIFMVVEKPGFNARISVGFYTCTIGPQISNLELKRLCHNFCPTSTIKIRSFTGLLTEEETKEVLNNFADNRWPRSSVFATPEAVRPLDPKKNFFITVGRYGMYLTKSCLLDKTHSVAHVSLTKLFWFMS